MINNFKEEEKKKSSTISKILKIGVGVSITDKIIGKINDMIKKNFVNQIELKEYLLSGKVVELWGTKLDGSKLHRNFEKTIDGPGGRAMGGCRYWDTPYNYMILWSNTDNDFRTIVLRNVEKIRVGNKIYLVK